MFLPVVIGYFTLISFYLFVLCGMLNQRNVAERKRKPKFSKEELDILVTEVTRNEARLFGRETIRLSHADRDKIWEGIARKITSMSQVPRSVKDIKHRWDDMKRRTKDKLAFMQRSLSNPGSTGRPSAIVLTAHERAIESTLHSSRQMHGFRRADLDVVDSPSTSCKYYHNCFVPAVQITSVKEVYYVHDQTILLMKLQYLMLELLVCSCSHPITAYSLFI